MQGGHRILQVLSHFRGFEPRLRRFFFMKSDIKWALFMYSNTLEIIRDEDNMKTQLFVYEMTVNEQKLRSQCIYQILFIYIFFKISCLSHEAAMV